MGFRRKIQDIVKAEDTQTDIFGCCELEPFDGPAFLVDSEVQNMHLKAEKNKVFMYAVGTAARKKTEPVGKLAIGIKGSGLDNELINSIGYIMFHYWNNEKAVPYKVTCTPRIVSKQDIPDSYLMRQEKDSDRFLLIDYNPKKKASIGTYQIEKVQKRGKERYMPFVTTLDSIV